MTSRTTRHHVRLAWIAFESQGHEAAVKVASPLGGPNLKMENLIKLVDRVE